MDILLINPPLEKKALYSCAPLGLLNIESILIEKGFDSEILDARVLNLSIEDIINIIHQKKPKIVGITATSYDLRIIKKMAFRIKQETNCFLVIGGAHANADSQLLLNLNIFDLVFCGEAEVTFPKIAEKIMNNQLTEKIIHGKVCEDLNSLPIPRYDLLPYKKYYYPNSNGTIAFIESSRGCTYNCTFCCLPKRKIRFKHPEKVVEEIIYLKNLGIKFFVFIDELITSDKNHIINLCKLIIKEKLDISWSCQTRCDAVDDETISFMSKAGCKIICFGIESENYKIRKDIRKRLRSSSIFRSIRLCKKYKIRAEPLFIIGFPNQTKQDMVNTVKFAKSLNVDSCHISQLILFPNTDIFKECAEKGIISKTAWTDFMNGGKLPICIPKGFTYDEFSKFYSKITRQFFFNPRYILRKLRTIKSFNEVKLIINFHILKKH